jgi:hypothetical protein
MADDIKVKLGLDVGEFFNGLNKVTTELNQMQNESKQTEQAFDKMVDIDTAGAVADVNKLSTAIDDVGDSAGGLSGVFEGLKGGIGDALSGGLIGGLVGGGLAAGIGAIADGFSSVIESGRELVGAQGDLQAATGASGAEFEQLKKSAEDAFLGGVGGSLAEATKAIANAKIVLKDALPNEEIGTFVKNAQALGTLYDKDVNEVVSKSAPFIRQFGLDGQKAFNLIAFASKEGKTSQDDVLDTLAEYSQLLSEAGFSAEEFAGQMAVAGQEGLFNTDKIADSIKEAQIRLKAGDTAKAITDLQASLPKALGSTFKELEGLASSGQISIKEFLQRSGGAIEEAFSAGQISDSLRSQLQVAIAGTPAEDLGAEAYARMFSAPIPADQIAAKALEAGKQAQNAAGQYLTFDAFTKKLELAFQLVSQNIVIALDGVFKTLSPIIEFVSNNLGTIGIIIGTITAAFAAYNIVVGLGTAITTAYAAVQTALGGSITLTTVAQYAWNLALSLNPVGAVVAAVAVLGAGIYALTDALSVSAEETRVQSEENVKLIETQKKANEEQTTMTKGTKSMADEFLNLANKKKLTSAESARLKDLTKDLSKEYPDLVKNTKDYKDNLDGVEAIANRAGSSLQSLAAESARLDQALLQANQTLSFAKRNEAIEEAIKTTKTLGVTTDTYGANAINAFANALYAAKTQEQATDAYTKATKELASNSKALTAVQSAYNSQIAALNAYKKTAETVVDTNKKLTDTTTKPKSEAKEQASDLEKLKEFYKDKQEAQKNDIERELADEKNKYADKKVLRAKLEAEANTELRKFLNERIGGISDANTFLKESQLTVKITPSKAKGETVEDINTFYTQEIVKLRKGLEVETKYKIDIPTFKEQLKEVETISKDFAATAEKLVPITISGSSEELARVQQDVLNFQEFLKTQNLEIAQLQQEAQIAGNEEAAQKFAEAINKNVQSINLLESRVKTFAEKTKEAQKQNTLEYQIQTALQTSFLDVFNSEKIRKEKETNEAIRKERLGALDVEENDLNKSLAKREISAEEYATKLAEINNNRADVESKTNKGTLDRFKEVADATAASVLKSQGDIFKKNAEKMEGNEKVFNEFVGNTLNQFSVLAASGEATLADFGAAAASAAFDAVAAMIPSFVTGILGSSITTLGPILGPLAAASLTGVLYGLLGLARSAAGFKDGVVGLDGAGTETSDSIPAWLSRGESVITARATKNNKEELEFMNRTGLSIAEFYKMRMPSTSVSVTPDGDLIREVRKLREETRGLGVRIQRNTSVEVSGVLTADSKSINALIVEQKRRSARRG